MVNYGKIPVDPEDPEDQWVNYGKRPGDPPDRWFNYGKPPEDPAYQCCIPADQCGVPEDPIGFPEDRSGVPEDQGVSTCPILTKCVALKGSSVHVSGGIFYAKWVVL